MVQKATSSQTICCVRKPDLASRPFWALQMAIKWVMPTADQERPLRSPNEAFWPLCHHPPSGMALNWSLPGPRAACNSLHSASWPIFWETCYYSGRGVLAIKIMQSLRAWIRACNTVEKTYTQVPHSAAAYFSINIPYLAWSWLEGTVPHSSRIVQTDLLECLLRNQNGVSGNNCSIYKNQAKEEWWLKVCLNVWLP